mgnify:CR=1 FL=1
MSADNRRRNLMRRAIMQSAVRGSAQRAKQAATAPDTDTTDYGEQTIQNRAEQVVGTAENAAISTARISYKQFRVMQDKREQRQKSTEKAAPAAKSQTASQPTIEVLSQQERREQFKRGRFRAISIEKAKPQTPKADSALPQEQISQSQLIKTRQQSLKRQHFIREAVRRHFQKQAEQHAATNIITPIRTGIPTLPGMSTPQKTAATRLQALFRYLMSAIKQLLARTARRTAATLLALLGAGGVVLLLAMVIGAAAAVIGSPMGILFADESGDPNSIRIAEIVAETNADFGEAINEIVAAHPECSETTIEYDYEDGHTWASYWPEVLAIFAVHTNLNSDSDVVVIDEGKKLLIQNTFWSMHQITSEIETVTTTPEPTEDEPDPEPVAEHILHITVSSKSVAELAEEYNFTQDQRDILGELLSDELRPYLLALCGGVGGVVGDGTLQWPLPGHTYISCHFGEVDAFGNAGHRGTDIPAPEGTPILAAHSGTVLVSGWNDSYGNQVLLDNGAGLSTRYAHMTATAVTAGETVTAGQVIGYVGSTGDSTGNHLHFEVMQNGARCNPLSVVNPQ